MRASVAYQTGGSKNAAGTEGRLRKFGRQMSVAKPTAVQLLMAWRVNKWVVARDNVEVAAYAYRSHAMACVRQLSGEAEAAGEDCYLLIREADGRWDERPCPRPPRGR